MTQKLFIRQPPNPIVLKDEAQNINVGNQNVVNVTFAQLAGDKFDAVVGGTDGRLYYFQNTSTADQVRFEHRTGTADPFDALRFTEPGVNSQGQPTIDNLAVAADFADLDGDGFLDLVVGDYNGNIYYFRNGDTGSGPQFAVNPTASTLTGGNIFGIGRITDYGTSGYAVPRFVEIEGDGGYHLFVGHYNKIDYYTSAIVNDQLQFTRQDQAQNPFGNIAFTGNKNRLAPTFGDINGDGRFDALVGQRDGTIRYFENTGTNTTPIFTERTGLENPFNEFDAPNGWAAPYLVDINNDDIPETFVGADEINSIPLFTLFEERTNQSLLRYENNEFVLGNIRAGGNNLQFVIGGKPTSQIANIKIRTVGDGSTEKLFSILPGGFIPRNFAAPDKITVDFADDNPKFQTDSRFVISLELFGAGGTTVVNFDTVIASEQGVWTLKSSRSDLSDLSITISQTAQLPGNRGLGVGLAQSQGLAVFELKESAIGTFRVYREASFTNQIGLYRVDDPLTGAIGSLLPGSAGYAQAAVRNRVSGFGLSVANQSVGSGVTSLTAGAYVPFIIVNGSFESFLNENPDNAPGGVQAYFAHQSANPDGQIHAMVLGNNTFGFEDLFGGGDFDYNDLIVQVDFA